MDKKQILIVEDDELVAEHCSIILQAMGYEVTASVASGKEAISIVTKTPPDLALVDISLEGKMDGVEVSKIIVEQYDVPTIFMSASSDEKLFSRAKKNDPLAFLIKPIERRQMELTVDLAFTQIAIKQKLKESEAHFSQAQEIGNIGSWSWDIVKDVLYWTDQIYRMFGLEPQEFGATYDSFLHHIHPDDRDKVNDSVNRALAGDGTYEVQHRIIQKNGKEREVIERGDVIFNKKGEAIFMHGTVHDITQLRKTQKLVEHMAYYDSVTGLPNRHMFFDRLQQSLALQRREDKTFAVLALDLDGFKQVNDTYGHQMGDRVLKEVAQRVHGSLRDVDIVARTGGDEFLAILWGIKQVENAGKVAKKLVAVCAEPFHIQNAKIKISCSIGVSICPDHGANEDVLIKLADEAMYDAKHAGKNCYKLFDPNDKN